MKLARHECHSDSEFSDGNARGMSGSNIEIYMAKYGTFHTSGTRHIDLAPNLES